MLVSCPYIDGVQWGLKRDRWLTPSVLLVAEQIVESKIIPPNMTSGCLDFFSWLAFSFEWGQATVMFELSKDPGIVKDAQTDMEKQFKVGVQDWRITWKQAEHCEFPECRSQDFHSVWQYSPTGLLALGLIHWPLNNVNGITVILLLKILQWPHCLRL